MTSLIIPDWPAPARVRAFSTTRLGGVSQPPWQSLNLGTHVGDDPQHVATNRQRLASLAQLPSAACWLNQTHSTRVVDAADSDNLLPDADASFSRSVEQVCIVMTADCLPILFCSDDGQQVAAAHAGWRGLCAGVVENTLATFHSPPQQIHAWLGPAIGAHAFEVGAEVKAAFMQQLREASDCFRPSGDKYLADLAGLATQRLQQVGVTSITQSARCTFSEPETFFSYRRDGQTGRLASLIWLAAS